MRSIGTPPIIMATGSNGYNSPFGVVPYNLHGLDNGRSYLRELCDKPDVYINCCCPGALAYTSNNIKSINDIHPDFVGFGVSAICVIDKIFDIHWPPLWWCSLSMA